MTRILLLLLSLNIVLSCNTTKTNLTSQKESVNYIPYYLKVYEADSLYYIGNYNKCYNLLDSLFIAYEPVNIGIYEEYRMYINCSILLGKNNEKKYFPLVSKYGYTVEEIKKDSTLNIELQTNNTLEKNLLTERKDYIEHINFDYRNQIIELNNKDQSLRKESINKYGYYTDEMMKLITPIDLINDSILKSLFIKNGFPNRNKIGKSNINGGHNYEPVNVLVLLNHFAKKNNFSFYKEYIYECLKKGECEPETYAVLLDSRNSLQTCNSENISKCFNNKVAKDSTYFFYRRFDVFDEILSHEDYAEIINTNRKLVGLPTIQQEIALRERYN